MTKTTNGISSNVTDYRVYNYEKEFQILPNNATYAGRFIVVDPRTKGKGYWGHMRVMMGASIKALFTNSIMPKDVEIDILNKLEEDSVFLKRKIKSSQNFLASCSSVISTVKPNSDLGIISNVDLNIKIDCVDENNNQIKSAEEFVSKGDQFISAGNFDCAISSYSKAIKLLMSPKVYRQIHGFI